MRGGAQDAVNQGQEGMPCDIVLSLHRLTIIIMITCIQLVLWSAWAETSLHKNSQSALALPLVGALFLLGAEGDLLAGVALQVARVYGVALLRAGLVGVADAPSGLDETLGDLTKEQPDVGGPLGRHLDVAEPVLLGELLDLFFVHLSLQVDLVAYYVYEPILPPRLPHEIMPFVDTFKGGFVVYIDYDQAAVGIANIRRDQRSEPLLSCRVP